MDYLHRDLKIIHRDLKAANIFLAQIGEKIEIKIGDFGHALNELNVHLEKYFDLGTLQWTVSIIKHFLFISILCTFLLWHTCKKA